MKADWREDNEVQLLINGEAYFPAAFEAIANAREQVLLETFIIFEDKVGKQLQQRNAACRWRCWWTVMAPPT
jgi:cardiolipin synthase